jgi:hypothetical protein
MTDHTKEKSHHECKCRNCDPITAMAERVDAYQAARSLIKELPVAEDMVPTPSEVLVLANWLYYGPDDEE